MRLRGVVTLALAGLVVPAAATAQSGACDVVSRRGETSFINANTPYQMAFIPAPVVTCTGGLRIIADSATMSEVTKMIEFIGSVSYRDTVKTLTTDYAQYFARERHVVAQGNVLLTDLKTGSVIQAPYLDYYQADSTRAEDLVIMHSGRPRAILVRRAQADSARSDTTVIDADGMEIHGDSAFIGRGNVEVTRAGTKAYGQYAEFMQGGGEFRLAGNARIEGDSLRMVGDSIVGVTDENEQFREVVAWGDTAMVDGEEVDVRAPWIRVLFDEGEVSRLVAAVPGRAGTTVAAAPDTAGAVADGDTTAVAPPPPAPRPREPETVDPSAPRAVAVSPDFRLVADSIDALAPGRALEMVTAVGGAFGERILPNDTLSEGLPEVAKRDWLRGDTIIATFVEAPPSEADTAAGRVLDRIVAVGMPATSLYRLLDEDDPDAGYSISYLLAQRIEVDLKEGEVADVRAEKQVQGLYLQPRKAAEDARRRTSEGGTGR